MMGILRWVRRSQRGANLIEMAIVLPLLFLFVAGVVDLGRAFNNYIIITNASREGARMASRFPHLPNLARAAAIQEAANSGVILSDGNIDIDPETGALPGQPIRVSIEYPFPTYLGGFVGYGDLILRTYTEMVVFGLDPQGQ